MFFSDKSHISKKQCSLLCLISLLCLFPCFIFSEGGNFQLKPGIEPIEGIFSGENRILSAKFETTVEVIAKCTYPHLYGNNPLINYVNKKLEAAAHNLFEDFIEQEKVSEEEHNDDFGGCYLDYQLFPVYLLPNLISFYGSEFQQRACPHGWTHHEGKNFCTEFSGPSSALIHLLLYVFMYFLSF